MPVVSDPVVAKAETRYPYCAVTMYKGKPILCLNPTERQTYRLLSFGLNKVLTLLRKWKAVEQFYRDSGSSHPEGTEVFEYQKKKMILLNPDESPRFQFGLEKAALIVLRKQALQNFAVVYGGDAAMREFNLQRPE